MAHSAREEDEQRFFGMQGDGRLIATNSLIVGPALVLGLSPGIPLVLAGGRLPEPQVQWTLVGARESDFKTVSIKLVVTGRDQDKVCFSTRIDEPPRVGDALQHPVNARVASEMIGEPRFVGPDGLIVRINTRESAYSHSYKMRVHIAVQENCTLARVLQDVDGLSSDFGKLLDEDDGFSDVVLRAKEDGTEIRAHKAVLAARSPFFQGLFTSNLAESLSNSVSVDFPAAVTKLVVRFAYTGKLELDAAAGEARDETTMALLAAADYYQISSLKRLCEEHLQHRVTMIPCEALLEKLVLADRYGALDLKEAILGRAAEHYRSLRPRREWSQFQRHHPDLAVQLVDMLADKLEDVKAGRAGRRPATRPKAARVVRVRSASPPGTPLAAPRPTRRSITPPARPKKPAVPPAPTRVTRSKARAKASQK